MRRIVHISDLHFGNNDPSLLQPLRKAIESIEPHFLVISGDLVEHASATEFEQARDFLRTLPKPQMVVPGNHDLAFYNFPQRATVGLATYKKYITDDLQPEYQDDEIAILGANTSRVWPIRGGSLSSLQLEQLAKDFAAISDGKVRILVTHHPFDLPEAQGHRLIVGHARRAITRLAPLVDILMAGHIHLSSTGSTAMRYKTQGHAIAFVQAGTAVSNRNKGETNSFNSLRVTSAKGGSKAAIIDRFTWRVESGEFYCKCSTAFRLESEGWARVERQVEHDAPIQVEEGDATPA
ncbi:MAG: metallophosphoesterase [Acidobacteriaceae bacterium]|nr:metallophosphoesterase [Acidobacteriaceae bacterium]MBV9037677.1 metallophosphoesterase [Acidobacteriaceae bacterium]MBV9677917.1 metallophosphoesterase [Acidobacteriaceae bacterium]